MSDKCKNCKKDDVEYIGEGALICMNCGQEYEWDVSNLIEDTASDHQYWGSLHLDPERQIKG